MKEEIIIAGFGGQGGRHTVPNNEVEQPTLQLL